MSTDEPVKAGVVKTYPEIPPCSYWFDECRRLHGKSGADMARIAGVEPMTYYRWRSGFSNPPWDKVRLIAAYFGLPVRYFYAQPTWAGPPGHTETYDELPGNRAHALRDS